MQNPWKKVGTRVVYSNPWITVREDEVIRPDGQPGIYSVVDARVATGVAALTGRNEVVLIGQWRYPLNRYSWEIVEGGADEGETPLQAAQRELREEAGFTARRWSPLGGEVHLSNCFTSEVAYLFVAEDLENAPKAPDGTEVLSIRRASLTECCAMLDSGEITDAMTVIALMRIRDRLRA